MTTTEQLSRQHPIRLSSSARVRAVLAGLACLIICCLLRVGEVRAQSQKVHGIVPGPALADAKLGQVNKGISVTLANVTIEEALDAVAEAADLKLTYIWDDSFATDRISLEIRNESALSALYKVLDGRGYRLMHSKTGYVLLIKTPKGAYDADAMEHTRPQHVVSGEVTSAEDGLPLPGVNIVVKGTSIGTISDLNGFYEIDAPSPQDTLVFSFVGFVRQEVPIASRTTIDAALVPDTEELSEVVIIGYGEKSRKLLTESIGTVSADEIRKVPVASPDQALQGRVSGVQITNVSGQPGSPVAVRIRGVGTVGNTQPLFVIDGIPVGRGEGATTNPLATINPSDIESMSVLKDASAAAVYGVRAANGVVLITTKRGQIGRPSINFDSYYGVQRTPDLWDMLSTQDYVALTQDAYDNFNRQKGLQPGDDSFLTLHPDLQSGSPYLNIDNSEAWINHAANDNAPIANMNLSVSGATDDLNYFVSGGYFAQDAIANRWDLERFSFRANSDYSIGSRFRFGESFSLAYQEVVHGVNGGGDGFLLRNAAGMPPFFRIFDQDNSIPGNRYGFDGNLDVAGLTIGNQNGINEIRDNVARSTRIIGGLYGELVLLEGLTYRSSASLDFITERSDSWNPGHTAEELGLDRSAQQRGDSRGEGATKVFTNTLNFQKSVGPHSIDAIAGIEYQKLGSTSISADAENFLSTDPDFYRVVKNGVDNLRVAGGASEGAFVGYISRLSYNFMDKYLLTGTLRRDGSSRFSPEDNRRWGTFPSISAAWRLGEESFFNVPFVSELKLRGSWGQLGNDQTTAFPHIFRVSPTPDYGLNGEDTHQAPAPINFVNKDVTWETVETVDFGVDVALFDNKVDLLATFFRRRTNDFLLNIPIPSITGFAVAPVNAGSVLNRGLEFELGYRNTFFEDLFVDVSANLTTVHNELTELAEGINEFLVTGAYRTAVGFPIGSFYGYKTDGIYQTPEEAAQALPDKNSPDGPRAGDVRFRDTNGPAPERAPQGVQFSGEPDGVIDFNDRVYLGKTIPDAFYGLNFNANYKRFDVSLFFQGVTGVQVYNQFRHAAESMTGGGRNQQASTRDRWTGPGTSDDMPRAVATDPNVNNRFSDRFVENGDFFRLKNIQIGFTVPAKWLRETASSARIYVSTTNLFTITPYTGLDPEVLTYRSNGSQIGQDVSTGNPPSGGSGTDEGNIPQPRTFQFGLQLQF